MNKTVLACAFDLDVILLIILMMNWFRNVGSISAS